MLSPVVSGCRIIFIVCQAFRMKTAIKKSHIIMSHCKGQPQYLFCHEDMIERQKKCQGTGENNFLKSDFRAEDTKLLRCLELNSHPHPAIQF